jgi:hypothetical protein
MAAKADGKLAVLHFNHVLFLYFFGEKQKKLSEGA